MQCKKPMIFKNSGGVPVPCGGCLPCRINERRVKTHRMMLESSQHDHCSFLTLTYDDDHLPEEFHHEKTGEIYARYSVNPAHAKAFTNNLQTSWRRKTGQEIKYFLCGEYGDKTQRPHYHLALFGYPPCLDPKRKYIVNRKFVPCECRNCSFLSKIWGKGHIFLGTLEQHSAQYVAGYVTKKLTKKSCGCQLEHHPKCVQAILKGRHPEFSRMSLKPALGKEAIIAHALSKAVYIKSPDDIPRYLVHNGKKWPLGRYLLEVYKKTLNFEEEDKRRPQKERESHDKVLSMFDGETLTDFQKNLVGNGLPETALMLLNAQRVLNLEKQHERKTLNRKGV